MNGWAILGLFLLLYAGLVVWITMKKPPKLWDMAKIRGFRKVLGETGTVIFFYIWAAIALVLGIWLLIR